MGLTVVNLNGKKMNENQKKKTKAAAVVGAPALALLMLIVPHFEGEVEIGYLDPIGIPTKCFGDTTNVEVGKKYSEEECLESLDVQLAKHGTGVLRCTPGIRSNPHFTASAVSFAYNMGDAAYCGSSIARAFNQGDYATACKRFNENAAGKPQWIYVKDYYDKKNQKWVYKTLPGLITRRAAERKGCERGLTL